MARKGVSEDAVSFKTNVSSIALSKAMMDDMIATMQSIKQYSNRSDFIIYAVRCFNEYSLDFLLKNISGVGSSELENKVVPIRKNMDSQLEAYYDLKDGRPNLPFKITYSMTSDLKEYIGLLNQNLWKFDTVQTYIRVAIIRLIEKYRSDRGSIMMKSDILGVNFVNFTCPIVRRDSYVEKSDGIDSDSEYVDDSLI